MDVMTQLRRKNKYKIRAVVLGGCFRVGWLGKARERVSGGRGSIPASHYLVSLSRVISPFWGEISRLRVLEIM